MPSHSRTRLAGLPAGTLSVGVGLIVLGATSYGFLVVAARALGPVRFAPLSALWALVFLTGPGCFVPFEQEVSRVLSEDAGRSTAAVVRQALRAGSVLLAVMLVVLAGASAELRRELFDGETMLVFALALSLVGFMLQFVLRGSLSARGDFGRYGAVLGIEGVARMAGCAVLAAVGVHAAGPYGLAVAAAPLASVAVALRRRSDTAPPAADAGTVSLGAFSGAVGSLLAGSLLSQILVNAAPVAVKALAAPDETELAGQFLAGLVVARVPLFLFQAIQAALLPGLAAAVGAGRMDAFRHRVARLAAAVASLGAVAVAASLALGPWVVRLVFGSEFELGRGDLALLALGNVLFILAVVFSQALVALARHAAVVPGWGAGVVGFFIALLTIDSLLPRVEWALVVGCAIASAVLLVLLTRAVARHQGSDLVNSLDVAEAARLPLEP